MAGEVVIGLNAAAAARLYELMQRFGEDRPEVMIARALGLLDIVKDYLNDQGVLTVVDPLVADDADDRSKFVELVFKKAAGRLPPRRAA